MIYRPEHPTTHRLRHLFLALAVLATLLTPLELVFAKHYTKPTMLIPFFAVAVVLMFIALVLRWPSPTALRLFQALMLLLFVVSAAGVFFHLWGNLEVTREVNPELRGLGLAWGVLSGAAPALAPGLLAFVGMLGLAFTFRHPVLVEVEPPPW